MDDANEQEQASGDSNDEHVAEQDHQVTITFERGDEVELAAVLLSSLGTDSTFDEGDFYRYDDQYGIWKPVSAGSLLEYLSRFAGCPVIGSRPHPLALSHKKIVGAISIARAQLQTYETSRGFTNAAPGVAFRNGFATVFDGKIYLDAHHPAHMARHAYPFEYVQDEPHPLLDEFFAQVFYEVQPDERVQQVSLLQEFVGTSLIGESTRHQRCLILLGNGANGKSTCLEIAESVFPANSVTSVPPQDWGKQFSTVALVGCLANLVNEIPEHDIVNNSIFKSIISGEPVRGERKFQESFKFRPRAGHIFAANSLPATNDQSDGFWRRFLIVPFDRNMEKAAVHRRGIAQQIVRAEQPAIVGWALEGAARVQRQRGYTESVSSTRLVAQWRRDTDSVLLFLETECVKEPNPSTSATILYQRYRIWAVECGFRPVSLTVFGKRAKQSGYKIKHTHVGNLYQLRLIQRNHG